MRFISFFALSLLLFTSLGAQNDIFPRLTFPVNVNGADLDEPFAGGLNNPQFHAADLNNDGLDDVVIFDRGGDKILTYLNNGTPGQSDYTFAPEYARHFPPIVNYMVMRDYNADGIADIFCNGFTNNSDRMRIFRGYYDNNQLHFEPYTFFYPNCNYCESEHLFYYNPATSKFINLPISSTDIPGVDDIDGDGDTDILTFEASAGGYVWFVRNMAVETGLPLDSLYFQVPEKCFGRFYESGIEACYSKLSTDPNICVQPGLEDSGNGPLRHPGSTFMVYDQEGDGDKELVLGDVSFSCLNQLVNGGTPELAWMTSQDTAFPSYDTDVFLPIFPAAFYLDLNNDSKKDMIVAPNLKTIGEDRKVAWYYPNTSSNANHYFELQTKSLFVGDMIDLGRSAHPAFVDVNADGLLDMVVGNETYYQLGTQGQTRLNLFLNEGTKTAPAFNLVDTDWLGMSQYGPPLDFDFNPAFGDIDGDNDIDMLLGSEIGAVYCFRNTAGPGNPMNLQIEAIPMWETVDPPGSTSAPCIYDMDNDGRVDIVMGERFGNVNLFFNKGTPTNPMFEGPADLSNLGQIMTGNNSFGFSAPVVLNTQNYGVVMIVGGQNGQLLAYSSITPSNDPYFLLSSKWGGIDEGNRSSPALADIDYDGIYEMAVGNLRGGLSLYKTDLEVPGFVATQEPAADKLDIQVRPNPARAYIRVETSGQGLHHWRLIDALGKTVASGNSNEPDFRIETVAFPAGIYWLELRTAAQTGAQKVVLK